MLPALLTALTALVALFCVPAVTDAQTKVSPLVVAHDVDYERYAGTWFEIARLPTYTQKHCASDVVSAFALQPDDTFEVRNSCLTKNGDFLEASGVARQAPGHPRASLQVRYGPGFLGFLPGGWNDYQIIELGEQYDYAVVGTSDRSSLRLLSRTPRMDPELYQRLVERARTQSFDVDALVLVPHTLT